MTRSTTARTVAGVALLLACAWSGPARAGNSILLQSHAGEIPDDAGTYVAQLVRALGSDAPLHGAALGQKVEASLSGTAGSKSRPVGIQQQVEQGRKRFINGEFRQAIAKLEQARGQLMKKVALVASDQRLRDTLHKASLFLAHAYLRDKQGERATERISEVIRSFPDRDLSLVRYGPDLATFYRKVRQELTRQPRGSLTITTEAEGCLVFVNERFVGMSPATVKDLLPGKYRIYVQRPRQQGRIHLVTLNGGSHQVTVDFGLDRVLNTEPFVGFRFEDRAAKEREEVQHAAAVARALDAPMVLLLGFHSYQGRRTLQGTAISAATSRIIRSGMVALEPAAPSPETLRALGQFLVAGKEGGDLIIKPAAGGLTDLSNGGGGAGAEDGPGFFSARIFKWITLGLGVASLATGVALIALDGGGTCEAGSGGLCPERYETMTPGIVLTAVGGAALVTSGILFYVDAGSAERGPAKSAALLPWFGRRSGGLAATVLF
jgi:hypothetical protein